LGYSKRIVSAMIRISERMKGKEKMCFS